MSFSCSVDDGEEADAANELAALGFRIPDIAESDSRRESSPASVFSTPSKDFRGEDCCHETDIDLETGGESAKSRGVAGQGCGPYIHPHTAPLGEQGHV